MGFLIILGLVALMLPTVRTLAEAYRDRSAITAQWPAEHKPALRRAAELLTRNSIRREWLRLLKATIAAVCFAAALQPIRGWLGTDATIAIRNFGFLVIEALLAFTSWLDYRGRHAITKEIQELRDIQKKP